jgi:hypothetical protein
MIERQIESPMPMPLVLVVKKALNSRSAFSAEIPTPQSVNTYQHSLCLVLARPDHQFERPIRDRLHGFDAIHHQVQHHLLQLDPIAKDHG